MSFIGLRLKLMHVRIWVYKPKLDATALQDRVLMYLEHMPLQALDKSLGPSSHRTQKQICMHVFTPT